jgi:hypothetical protein
VFVFEGDRQNATKIAQINGTYTASKGRQLLIVSQTFSNASNSSVTFKYQIMKGETYSWV